ncbi:hypothetical protein [Nocardia seriolae]|uniref:hypothetical protein n=1 Tax=Nocardia seriolae TaxID=37332 RepID=UPI000519F1D7|nr:hypothetical protein [Nocardia seriolae]MTJ61489.1 hypothetical protein [Nocardia seriolae]MTJ71659.1 hypothetical protein [Nocardia seriolae]MTJ86520.1 hypothetical protein [Nocardia seriolae]MTK30515.1 hypothetical protein [Nocardia seriolae]MTK39460.1 hypothetical protein [Nocardia seriolae]
MGRWRFRGCSARCTDTRPDVTVDALAAAGALALITPVERALPDIGDHRLTPTVARHVSRVLGAATADRPTAHP